MMVYNNRKGYWYQVKPKHKVFEDEIHWCGPYANHIRLTVAA